MIKIVLIIKENCPACSIVKRVITEAINKIECDITLRVLSNKGFRADSYNVKVYPTTIFYKAKSAKGTIFEGNFEEIARLEGSFPIDYLNKVIDKLKLECNE